MFSRESGWTVRYISRVEQAIGQFRLGVFSNAFQAGASGPGPWKGAQKPRSTPNRQSPLLSNDQTKYRLKKWWNQGFSIENLLWRFRLRFCISISEMESHGRETIIGFHYTVRKPWGLGAKARGLANAMVEGAQIKKNIFIACIALFLLPMLSQNMEYSISSQHLVSQSYLFVLYIYRVRYVFIHLFTYLIPTFSQLMYLMSLLSLS
jgi:hypothetical protein